MFQILGVNLVTNQSLIQEKKVAMSSASDWGLVALPPVLSANVRTKLLR